MSSSNVLAGVTHIVGSFDWFPKDRGGIGAFVARDLHYSVVWVCMV